MIKWAKNLFPICRSLISEGNRETIKYFRKINPEFKILKFKSRTKVFDWIIPDEWMIKDSYLKHESGKKFAEFKKSNLHVVNYSQPINKIFTKKEILKKIFTEKSMPDAIPYVTSYYNKDWGFCLSENDKKKLPNGKYKAFIDSKFKKSYLDIAEAVIKGKSKKEIFFSSYSPSMANNELSGPVLLNALLLYLKENYKKPNLPIDLAYCLRPLVQSLTFQKKEFLKEDYLVAILTCVGDERSYSFVKHQMKILSNSSMKAALFGKSNVKNIHIDRGSDERQYCARSVELPVCSFSKSKTFRVSHK